MEFYPLSDALKELNEEILIGGHSSSVTTDDLQSQLPWVKGVPGLCFSCCEFTENLTSGPSSDKERNTEAFTALSREHIEGLSIEKSQMRAVMPVTRYLVTRYCNRTTLSVTSNLMRYYFQTSNPITVTYPSYCASFSLVQIYISAFFLPLVQ